MESLTYRGTTNGAYSVTSGSTTSIYVKKSEAYDQLGVLEFLKDSYDEFTVTWKNEFVSSLPSGYKTATQVFSPGTANTAQVLTGYTFSSANGTNLSGTMANRGNLNWSGSNTTYSVPAGYYSGGTLDSRPSYNNGYNAGNSAGYNNGYNDGVNAGRNSPAFFVSHGSQNPPNDNSATYYLPSTSYAAANVGISQNSHATIQISGTYRLFGNATWTGADPKNMFANVYVNGSSIGSIPKTGTRADSVTMSWFNTTRYLSVGNTVQLRYGQTGGSSNCVVFFGIVKIG